MKNSPLLLCAKAALFLASVVLVLLPLAAAIRDYQRQYEPRTSLLNRVGVENYRYALMGDSVFCSYYVSNDGDTIWNKFEAIAGHKMFPGALNGAKKGDMTNAAEYMSKEMQAGSTVFVDVIPTKFMPGAQNSINNYDPQFADLLQDGDFVLYKWVSYLDVKYLAYLLKLLSPRKHDLHADVQYDRRWHADGDFAKKRYADLLRQMPDSASCESMQMLDAIQVIFKKRKITPVFVLTPLNKDQIYAFSEPAKADQVYSHIKDMHQQIKDHLRRMDASVVDLFEAIPSDCFADLLHTNACGDEAIARSLAAYASQAGR